MKDRIRIEDGNVYVMLEETEAAAIVAGGKYREDKPFWKRFGNRIGALMNEQFTAWRADRTGKRL